MKIVYIGAGDALAETLAERMGQEGHDVYLLSDKAIPKKPKGVCLHRFYRTPRKGESFGKLVRSISPNCVIFAGNHYISDAEEEEEESDGDVTLLTRALRAAAAIPQVRFILLSSTEVYGNTAEKADETAECAAVSERGIRFIREEQLLDIYRKQHGVDATVLRVSQLYTDRPREDADDFLSGIFSAAAHEEDRMESRVYQPLHVSDFADAVKRVVDSGTQQVYNVCGGSEISAERLYELACRRLGIQEQAVRWEKPDCTPLADSGRIRRELGWRDFRTPEEQLRKGEISYTRVKEKGRNRKKWSVPKAVRRIAENLVLFEVFMLLQSLCASSSVFSHVNWLMVYVIAVSVAYNIYQSALAAILATAAYLYNRGTGLFEITAFYSYADLVLAFVQFISLGLLVSYTVSVLKQDAQSLRLDLDMLREEYEDLKAINDENVLIKNEYETRLLSAKTGFPKLYDMVSRLMVREPDRILMETMQIISELVGTDTVAVYRGQAKSPWLRLAAALGDSSVMSGKSWNLSDCPNIYNAVVRGELYQGEIGSGEPAVVMPVVCRDVPLAVILIKTLPYESETLYHINLLKTLSMLLRDAMEKALQYEELSRESRYVKDTDILKPEAFREQVLLAGEKDEKGVAEYCVAELLYSGPMAQAAEAAGRVFRATDCLGTDGNGRLFALLNNTGPQSLEYLRERLELCGMEVRLAEDEQAASDEAADVPLTV